MDGTVYYEAWEECAKYALIRYPAASQMTTHLHMKVRAMAEKLEVTAANVQRFTTDIRDWLKDGLGHTRGTAIYSFFEFYVKSSQRSLAEKRFVEVDLPDGGKMIAKKID
jgi:hypothetical protein